MASTPILAPVSPVIPDRTVKTGLIYATARLVLTELHVKITPPIIHATVPRVIQEKIATSTWIGALPNRAKMEPLAFKSRINISALALPVGRVKFAT